MNDSIRLSNILRFISAILLIIAIGNHPYSYYQILRWIVSGTSFYSGWVFSQIKKNSWAWVFFIIGIIFNPILLVYLDKSTWVILDLITAILFFYSLVHIKNEKSI